MRDWSLREWVIAVIIVCAVIGVLWIALPEIGVVVPAFIVNILWILFVVVVAIAAINFLFNQGGGKPSG